MTGKIRTLIIGGGLLVLLFIAYSNHFDNGFYFDDTHTITNNTYIRDIGNIPYFFTDIKYYGTMQGNQGYNPVLVMLNTIDYVMAGSLDQRYFHGSIFFWYVVMLVMMFFFLRKIFRLAFPSSDIDHGLIAALSAGFYALHAANAETINYIIMRSDSFSTLCIIASFLLYQWPAGKKYYLYLITFLIGIGTKETVFMFGLMLFFYIYLFEENLSLTDIIKRAKWQSIQRAIWKSLPANIVAVASFIIIRKAFIPEEHVLFPGAEDHSSGIFPYFITQWYIIVHYIGNFILPLDLSADPDFEIATTIWDRKILLSLAVLLILAVIAVVTSRNRKYTPVSFGIIWFFLALAPTSTFHPLGQLSNDHRTFFPYIGLVMALGWYLGLVIHRNLAEIRNNAVLRYGIIGAGAAVLLLHAYGTYQRNKVWDTAETLWADVAVKSPKNGRGLMNYGLTQMQKGNYDSALDLFQRAMELMPRYSYLHINMGILRNAMGYPVEAEKYFENGLRFGPANVEAYYYYANWLVSQNREGEAKILLLKGQELSPGHENTQLLLQTLLEKDQVIPNLENEINTNPTPEKYLELSIAYYRKAMYDKCVEACQKAIALKPDYADAYNNMCSAYILLNQPDKAIEACKRALEIEPEFQLAKNNLRWAETVRNEQN